ncbi:hypothetical protein GQ43DRAFT_469018 [Delitschia confertaspora ATCC 74209]|uniref:PSP1 C-terminal domain-containing protein n=1 Tax=Delitschia confertaspora ATCC 74209 TaxID=1513339 RepID=A0A9P4N285_9PLEO|nr:hypothetical protein GQ43DRAFT_469018 [Delitschia confertaspora ATCC 74209]
MSYQAARAGSGSGPSFAEKAKIQLRRPTPDSDVLASSDDDHEHSAAAPRPAPAPFPPRRMSSGWLHDIQPNRKFSLPSTSLTGSQPTTPAVEIPHRASTSALNWNTTSFSAQTDNRTSRLKEVVPSPTTVLPAGDRPLPSPTITESEDGIGFLLNQGPIRKSVRSQSYSVGQHELEVSVPGQFPPRLRSSLRHRPSKPSLLGESGLGLAQLREDDIDEVESSNGSEHGIRLPQGYYDQQQKQATGALLKQAAVENARSRHRATSTSSPVSQHHRKATQAIRTMARLESDFAIDEVDDAEQRSEESNKYSLLRRFSEIGSVRREPEVDHIMDSPKKHQWVTSTQHGLGMDNLGRRHSFATVGSYGNSFPLQTLSKTYEEDEEPGTSVPPSQSPLNADQFDAAAYFTGYGPASRAINASAISAAHPAPTPEPTSGPTNPYAVPTVLGRSGRRLFVVAFKCSRADIYYTYDNTGLEIRRGDLVIVEGDRGCDLGQVTHANVSLEDAKKYKAAASEEHFRWLVMFSQYSLSGTSNDSSMLGALARANGYSPNNHGTVQPMGFGTVQEQETKPKLIKRLAQKHEIDALRDKEGQEAKAKRIGAQKAAEHKLPMEILDAEYQADYHKLTYFYYADAYVNFNDLVTDLFKQYKVRIWMSAVNPASVVNPTGLMQVPPPSAIGPGAIIHSNSPNASLPVGPGFGSPSYRGNEQYGRSGGSNLQGNGYDESFYPFANQIPAFNANAQGQYAMQWGQGQQAGQDALNRYSPYPVAAGGYPNVTASGTPVNFNAYYPPTTYASSPSYPLSSTPYYAAAAQSTPGSSYGGAYGSQGQARNAHNVTHTTVADSPASYTGTSAAGPSYGNGYTAPNNNTAYGAAYINAFQNLSLNK